MRTIMINGSDYATPHDMHLALKKMLSLPDYYGCNADALNDCLSDFTKPVSLWIAGFGTGEVAEALKIVCSVFEDNGGVVKEL